LNSDHAFLSTDYMSYFRPESKITPDLLVTIVHSFLTGQAKII
jgi:hypothetical protein